MKATEAVLSPLGKKGATGLPLRYVLSETCISAMINACAATLPVLCSATASPPRTLHAAAVSLTPQIAMGAAMSVLAPSLLTRWRQSHGRMEQGQIVAPPTLLRTLLLALGSAAIFTLAVLAFMQFVLPSVVSEHVDWVVQAGVSATQGILAATLLTPLALCFLFKGIQT